MVAASPFLAGRHDDGGFAGPGPGPGPGPGTAPERRGAAAAATTGTGVEPGGTVGQCL